MYYYIFEPPQGPKDFERTSQIKELLSTLGIAGEMTTPGPGRSVIDLVQMAIAKRYSTIVAVGGVGLINEVARSLEPHDVVFGIIPAFEHPDIARLIGVSDWKNAAEQLKRRRFKPVRQGVMNEHFYFLTPATLQPGPDISYELSGASFSVKGRGDQIVISPARYESEKERASFLVEIIGAELVKKVGFLQGLFSGKETIPTTSKFQLEKITITTSHIVQVNVAGAILTSTPISCRMAHKPLKLIVGRSSAFGSTTS